MDALVALVAALVAEEDALVALVAALVAAASAAALELVTELTSLAVVPVPLKKLDFAMC